jgi:hypothetical protein
VPAPGGVQRLMRKGGRTLCVASPFSTLGATATNTCSPSPSPPPRLFLFELPIGHMHCSQGIADDVSN